ncbi:MAG: UDP-N-acetylmuramate--L-alanine ligase [Nitrospirae bacterium]|nr:UDP-N-acetylmuramate--L-alanine ligase [Nitrospirota bacterium]
MFKKIQQVHFIGIGGSGMSGIAEVLLNLGYRVTGSDLLESETTRRLESGGGTIYVGHHPSQVKGAHVVVVSSAVDRGNPEIEEARRLKIPVIPRAEMLAELMRLKYGVAVAGSHGKTTTTSMIAMVLAMGGLYPTAVIGGKLNLFGGHSKLGQGNILVAEADESDGSFLKLSPTIAVVTNIDREHLDFYQDLESIKKAFLEFANKVPFYGCSVICLDDPINQTLFPFLQKRVVTCGLHAQSDIQASNIESIEWRSSFDVTAFGESLGTFKIKVHGIHNIKNALASIAVGLELDVEIPMIQKGLSEFGGADRRFHLIGERKKVMVVDDYGHHPTEIMATLAAAKRGWKRRLVVIFQPHRYTRSRDLMEEFVSSFDLADLLLVTDIYGAGEPPIPGISGETFFNKIKKSGHRQVMYFPRKIEWGKVVVPLLEENDLLLTLGAGDIWKAGEEIFQCLNS